MERFKKDIQIKEYMSGKIVSSLSNFVSRKQASPSIDFYVEENNRVRGLYVVSPRILELDNPELFGVPFIFYVGTEEPYGRQASFLTHVDSAVDRLRKLGVPYLTSEQYDELVKDMYVGSRVPRTVKIGERTIPIERLVSIGHVPYSFSSSHAQDILRKVRVRTKEEYEIMVRGTLPRIKK